MSLSNEQIDNLIRIVGGVSADQTDCDGCLGYLAEFAELELAGKTIPEAMRHIQVHLENCFCCKKELACLLDALKNQVDDS